MGDTAPLQKGSINIIDDTPVAHNDTNVAKEGGNPTVNLVLIIDTSDSMNDPADGIAGHASRLVRRESRVDQSAQYGQRQPGNDGTVQQRR